MSAFVSSIPPADTAQGFSPQVLGPQTLKMSCSQLGSLVRFQGELEVDGIKVRDGKPDNTPTYRSYLRPPQNLMTYRDIMGNSRDRVTIALPQPRAITHALPKPAIVIPCHTNEECQFCQLYDEPHEDHMQETPTPKLGKPNNLFSKDRRNLTAQQATMAEEQNCNNKTSTKDLSQHIAKSADAVPAQPKKEDNLRSDTSDLPISSEGNTRNGMTVRNKTQQRNGCHHKEEVNPDSLRKSKHTAASAKKQSVYKLCYTMSSTPVMAELTYLRDEFHK